MKTLDYKEFKWINTSDSGGYYSLWTNNYELCIFEETNGDDEWVVTLSNVHQEVINEVTVKTKREAIATVEVLAERIAYELKRNLPNPRDVEQALSELRVSTITTRDG